MYVYLLSETLPHAVKNWKWSELWSLKCPKIAFFLQFCAGASKKPYSIRANYICVSEIPHYVCSENYMIYKGLSHHSWDINNENIKKDSGSAEN